MVVYETDRVMIFNADSLAALRTLPDCSIDSVVTDPPYGLGFMNRAWDKDLPGGDLWREILRVLKPGGHMLALGGTRTYHRLVCLIEDAGFEIRDCLMWLYGSGFPKSHNVALGIDKKFGHANRGRAIPTASTYQACDVDRKNKLDANPVPAYEAHTPEAGPWIGWGTGLKPAHEPICLARKPFKGTVADNVLQWGTGALNIDGCRVPSEPITINRFSDGMKPFGGGAGHPYESSQSEGRWPANILHDGSDEVVGMFPGAGGQKGKVGPEYGPKASVSTYGDYGPRRDFAPRTDTGSAARFFYCAKASKKEREAGLSGDGCPVLDGRSKPVDNPYLRGKTERLNTWPTVKPLALMRYLCRLITPPDGTILEPFMGSGSTVIAALEEGFSCVAVDREAEACQIAIGRLGA